MAQPEYISGTINVRPGEGCFVGNQKIACPSQGQRLFERPFMGQAAIDTNWHRDILPQNFMADFRSDLIFISILVAVVGFFVVLIFSKLKVFSKTLAEYCRPIWPLMIGAVAVVLWQYMFGVVIEGGNGWQLRISQWLWELMVVLSVYILWKKYSDFKLGNAIFLGVIYSFLIHGLKVTIRYFFYGKSLFYVLDRFLYGSLLVMALALAFGVLFIYVAKKKPATQ